MSKCLCRKAAENIRDCVFRKNDLIILGKIEGMDLLAREARYHESCRKSYVRNEDRSQHRVTDQNQDVEGATDNGKEHTMLHSNIFVSIVGYRPTYVRYVKLTDIYIYSLYGQSTCKL